MHYSACAYSRQHLIDTGLGLSVGQKTADCRLSFLFLSERNCQMKSLLFVICFAIASSLSMIAVANDNSPGKWTSCPLSLYTDGHPLVGRCGTGNAIGGQ